MSGLKIPDAEELAQGCPRNLLTEWAFDLSLLDTCSWLTLCRILQIVFKSFVLKKRSGFGEKESRSPFYIQYEDARLLTPSPR